MSESEEYSSPPWRVRVFNFIGWFIGWLWFDVLRIRRGIVLNNLRLAFPEWEERKRLEVGRRSMSALGKNIVDVFRLPFVDEKWVADNVEFQGMEHLQKALGRGKGVFGLGMHLASGDLSIASLNYFDLKVNLISKRFKTSWLNNYWFRVRQAHGTRLIEDRDSATDIMRALKRNELVIFVLDQFMGPPLGVETKFFGKKTGTAMGLALLAERTGAAVLPCYTYNRPDGTLVNVFGEEIPFQDLGTREESIQYMTQLYTDKIEEVVRKYPGQWMWVHRRWKEFKA